MRAIVNVKGSDLIEPIRYELENIETVQYIDRALILTRADGSSTAYSCSDTTIIIY